VIVDRVTDGTAASTDATSASAGGQTPATSGTGADGRPAEDPAASTGRTIALVRIVDARNRTTLYTKRISGNSPATAVKTAAYMAAGWVIERSNVVPPWAEWNAGAAEALAVHTEGGGDDDGGTASASSVDGTAERPTTTQLLDAVQHASRSGLLAVEAGNTLSMEKRYGEALGYYARSSALYQRYMAGRYRTAVALSLLASDPDRHWWSLDPAQRASAVYALVGAGEVAAVDSVDPTDLLLVSDDWGTKACRTAEAHLVDLEDRLHFSRVLVASLRRRERSYWLKHLWGGGHRRKRLRATIETARVLVHTRRLGTTAPDDDIERMARKYATHANALYNLACLSVTGLHDGEQPLPRARRARAIELLEQARDAPGGAVLRQGWLLKDPDLDPLRQEPRFNQFLDTILP